MPIFRILGGGNSSSSSSSSSNNASRSFMGGSGHSSGGRCNRQQRSFVSSQSTYPGLRLQRSSNNNCNHNNNNNVNNHHPSNDFRRQDSITSIPDHRGSSYVDNASRSGTARNPPGPPSAAFSPVVIRGSLPTARSSVNNNTASGPYVRSGNNNGGGGNVDASAVSASQTTARPGAYAVTRSTAGMQSQVYRVTVPPGVVPGNEFTVHAGNRRVRVRCPLSSRPGHSLQITLPPEPVTNSQLLRAAPLTRPCRFSVSSSSDTQTSGGPEGDDFDDPTRDSFPGRNESGGGAVPMTPEVRNVNRAATNSGGTAQTFLVTIPDGVYPGMQFNVNANGQRFQVTCPQEAGPGKKVRIVPPAQEQPQERDRQKQQQPEVPLAAPKMQVYEVIVPQGVRPNQPFTLMANGQRVLVTCPPNVGPGQKIRFNLPVQGGAGGGGGEGSSLHEKAPSCRLLYKDDAGSSGWCRTIRVTDMKFQWVRVDNNNKDNNKNNNYGGGRVVGGLKKGDDDYYDNDDEMKKTSCGGAGISPSPSSSPEEDGCGEKRSSGHSAMAVEDMGGAFDFGKAAYVRKIQYLEGNDARMRTGTVSLVPAQDAVVASKLVDHNYHGTEQTKTLLCYQDIAAVQSKTMEDKIDWFHKSVCEELYAPWEKGHVKIVVRRHNLLSDSVDAVMSLGRDDMRKRWRIEFVGEPGIEAGGLTREWFQLVTEQIFDPDFGLWLSSNNNQMSMTINAASHISCPDDHLIYFRFLGRVMGRALFDRQLIKGHMVRHLYKHILGWPITFEDVEAQDEEYYNALKKFTTMEDLSVMCLDFTVTEETLGVRNDVELIPGGSMKEVTSENLPQYLEANLKYRMLNRCKPQTTELMLGFFDIIPEPALTVFDPNELELILCGLPTICMDDWMDNTKYSGYYEARGRQDPVVEWFWDVVQNEFDMEMKARLLQFVTGTSGVPPRGFSVLQGNDGNIKKFCVHGVSRDQYVYPRAHTCFNRIDLPNYSSKKELHEKLGQAVSMTYVGFDIE